jgi:hypothetical protein
VQFFGSKSPLKDEDAWNAIKELDEAKRLYVQSLKDYALTLAENEHASPADRTLAVRSFLRRP